MLSLARRGYPLSQIDRPCNILMLSSGKLFVGIQFCPYVRIRLSGARPFLTEFYSNTACIGGQRCLRGILYT